MNQRHYKFLTRLLPALALLLPLIFLTACSGPKESEMTKPSLSAAEILGNPDYLAMSYGGYRATARDTQPTMNQLKDDLKILFAMGVRIVRTYNVQLAQAGNVVKAISELKKQDPDFEMYVMLGAWIDAKNAWTGQAVDHNQESEKNAAEIDRAVALTKQYPDIVKVIAVGNEAMVKWATSYFVQPNVILKWVNHLQGLKKDGQLPTDLWITSSDNFASWGGGDAEYHVEDLNKLIHAVDYISMHTYPMHDTHYNPVFWGVLPKEEKLSKEKQIEQAMKRARDYADQQYRAVKAYVKRVRADKPIHIGETGWASSSNGHYGKPGSLATDEYKEGLYYQLMREWTAKEGMSCFYFEAFDEPWKDAGNPGGSENFFGLFTVDGKAKYPMWSLVDQGIFAGLSRDSKPITKTYDGNKAALLESVSAPPVKAVLAN